MPGAQAADERLVCLERPEVPDACRPPPRPSRPASGRSASSARCSGASDRRSPSLSADHSRCITPPLPVGKPESYGSGAMIVTLLGQNAQLRGHWARLPRRSPRRPTNGTRAVISSPGYSGDVTASGASPASRSCPKSHALPDEPASVLTLEASKCGLCRWERCGLCRWMACGSERASPVVADPDPRASGMDRE